MPRLWLRVIRDIAAMRGRAMASGLIVACGVALGIGVLSGAVVLRFSVQATWDELNLAAVTINYSPALEWDVPDLSREPGVSSSRNELQLPAEVTLPNGTRLPAVVLGTSVRTAGEVPNLVDLLRGSLPLDGQALAERGLADFHGVAPGDRLQVTSLGRDHGINVSGIGTSPEYLVATSNPQYLVPVKGSLAVLLVPLATAQQWAGAPLVNRTVLLENAPLDEAALAALRVRFEPLGLDAFVPRQLGFGWSFLNRHINSFASFLPPMVAVFTIVSVVALVVTMNRLVVLQRGQIGALRAMGYGRAAVSASFAATGLAIGMAGAVAGCAVAVGLGYLIAWQYALAVGLPSLGFSWSAELVAAGIVLGSLVALVAALVPAVRAASITPRDALQPPLTLGSFPGFLGRMADALSRPLPLAARVAVRNLSRRPTGVATTVLGVALSLGLAAAWIMLIRSMNESVYAFFANDQWIYQIELRQPLPEADARLVLRDAGAEGEPFLQVPAVLRTARDREYVSVAGVPTASGLVQRDLLAGSLDRAPPNYVVLSEFAADRLGLALGQMATLEAGERSTPVVLSGIVRGLIGDRIFVSYETAQALAGRGDSVPGFVSGMLSTESLSQLTADPRVASIIPKSVAYTGFRSFQDQMLGVVFVAVAMSVLSALTVLWSGMAVSLLEREAEFATLRARGYGRRQITAIVAIEVTVQTLLGMVLAVPAALVIVVPLVGQLAGALRTSLQPYVYPQDLLLGLLPALVLAPFIVWLSVRQLMRLNLGLTVKRSIAV